MFYSYCALRARDATTNSSQDHCRVHSSPTLVHILSQINPAHALSHNFFKIYFKVILVSTPKSSKWSLPFWYSDQSE
jgi:hypothetical protein